MNFDEECYMAVNMHAQRLSSRHSVVYLPCRVGRFRRRRRQVRTREKEAGETDQGEQKRTRRMVGERLGTERISAAHLRKIAERLGLTISAAPNELRLMIEKEVSAKSHEPMNVHVVVGQEEEHRYLWLRDKWGIFL